MDRSGARQRHVQTDVVLVGRVGPDDALGLDAHVVRVAGGGADRPRSGAERVVLVLDVVVVEVAVVARQPDGGVEELVGGVREVHHEPVGGVGVLVGDRPHVPGDRGHAVGGSVALGVLSEVLDRALVEIAGDHARAPRRHRDGVGTDAGEHIDRGLVRLDLFDHAVALGGEPRGEVHLGHVQEELVAVLAVDGLGAVPRQHVPAPDAQFALDRGRPVEHGLAGYVRGHHRLGDLAGALVVVLVDDDDVAEPLQRGLVAEYRGGGPRAVALGGVALDDRRREVAGNRLGVGDGDVDRVAVDRDLVVAVEDVGVGESLADGLAALALDRDAGNAHCREETGRAINADALAVERGRGGRGRGESGRGQSNGYRAVDPHSRQRTTTRPGRSRTRLVFPGRR